MDEAIRQEFLARIRQDAASIEVSDRDLVEHALGIMLRMANDPRMGPLTFLMPDATAVERIDFDDDAPVPPEFRDQCIGLLLDQMVIGILPSPSELDRAGASFSTLGGATASLSVDDAGLVLTDTTGRKVRVSEPVIDGPKLVMRTSNDFLMWDEWAWR